MGLRTFAIATLLPLAAFATDVLTIDNACSFDIYVLPAAGDTSTTIPSQGNITLPIAGSGVNVEVDTDNSFASPMAFDYSVSDYIYYDISTINGDPFEAYGFSLTPDIGPSTTINCPPSDSNDCAQTYNPGQTNGPVYTAPTTADFVLQLC